MGYSVTAPYLTKTESLQVEDSYIHHLPREDTKLSNTTKGTKQLSLPAKCPVWSKKEQGRPSNIYTTCPFIQHGFTEHLLCERPDFKARDTKSNINESLSKKLTRSCNIY